MFQEQIVETSEEVYTASFHQGFNMPKAGAYKVDLNARRIQEATEALNVSTLGLTKICPQRNKETEWNNQPLSSPILSQNDGQKSGQKALKIKNVYHLGLKHKYFIIEYVFFYVI